MRRPGTVDHTFFLFFFIFYLGARMLAAYRKSVEDILPAPAVNKAGKGALSLSVNCPNNCFTMSILSRCLGGQWQLGTWA